MRDFALVVGCILLGWAAVAAASLVSARLARSERSGVIVAWAATACLVAANTYLGATDPTPGGPPNIAESIFVIALMAFGGLWVGKRCARAGR